MAAADPTSRGFTLIELVIVLAIMAVLMVLGLPVMSEWIADSRVRIAAESVQTGIMLARAESIRRNTPVRFQLTSTLDDACELSNAGNNWVVSLDDPTESCDVAPSEDVAPRIIQIRSGAEGGGATAVAATRGGAPANLATFVGTGRLAGFSIDTINIANPAAGTCQHEGGNVRCLRIRIMNGGDSRICDPKVTNVNDLRRCP